MVSYLLGFIPQLGERFSHLSELLRLRSVKAKGLSQRLKIFRIIALTVLANALHDSREQAIDMELRGFRNGEKHQPYYSTHLSWTDWILLLAMSILFIVLILS